MESGKVANHWRTILQLAVGCWLAVGWLLAGCGVLVAACEAAVDLLFDGFFVLSLLLAGCCASVFVMFSYWLVVWRLLVVSFYCQANHPDEPCQTNHRDEPSTKSVLGNPLAITTNHLTNHRANCALR